MQSWHTAHRCYWVTVSRKPGTQHRDVLEEILSRKPRARLTDVSGQMCHENLAHGTETFQGINFDLNLPHGNRRFIAIVSCKPGTQYRDVLMKILSRLCGTQHIDVLGQLRHVCVKGNCVKEVLGQLSRKPGTRYKDVLGEILSHQSGTRHTDVSWQLRHVKMAHSTETY